MAVEDMPGDQAGAIKLLWEHRSPPKRGPRPTLTLADIAAAGMDIADTDGLGAVTMQRVAAALGVTKMALYRYMPGKVELVAVMTDTAIGAPARLDTVSGGWRPELDVWAKQMFDRFWRHPWVLEATVGIRALGPNELGWLEQVIGALTDTGLDGGEMLDVAATLTGHVRTIAQHSTAMVSEQAMNTTLTTLLHTREDQFPALTAALDSAVAHDSQDQALEFGLGRILDGVELLIADYSTADSGK